MEYFVFILKSAFSDLMKNKLRTFLTTLGIVIGVTSVVLLIAFGLGLRQYIQDQFSNLGTNLIFVLPGQIFNSSNGFRASMATATAFDEKDLQNLRKVGGADKAIPVYQKSTRVEAMGDTEVSTLYGTTQEIFPTRNLEVEYGEAFVKTDVDKRTKVVVLGSKVAENLFKQPGLAVGERVRIEDQSFKVIGVLKSKGGGGFGGPNFDTYAYVPYKTVFVMFGKKMFNAFVVKAKNSATIPSLKQEIKKVFLDRYEESDFTVADSKEVLNTVQAIFGVLNSILVAIGAVSLIVGGIGIMNIMYVSVSERVREIGIRRAIGAMEKDILYQFLAEAVLLSLLGGFLGLVLAYCLVFLIRIVFPAYIDVTSMILAIAVSSLIGIFFGVFPARKAAKLSPIDAIRYE